MYENEAQRTIADALAIQDDVEFADALMQIISCETEEQYHRLPSALKSIVAVNAFSLETSGGGFYQLMANTSREVLSDIEEGLLLIEAREASRSLDQLRTRFPDHTIPADPLERLRILDELDGISRDGPLDVLDERYKVTGENVLTLMKVYVAGHMSDLAAQLAAISG